MCHICIKPTICFRDNKYRLKINTEIKFISTLEQDAWTAFISEDVSF